MKAEFKPLRVTFQITRNLSDCRNPRYMAKFDGAVIADGRTLNEVRDRASNIIRNVWDGSVSPEFLIVVE